MPHFPQPDPLIYQMGLALKTELEMSGAGSRLYAEAMANALIIHLIKRYTVQPPTIQNLTAGAVVVENLQEIRTIPSQIGSTYLETIR